MIPLKRKKELNLFLADIKTPEEMEFIVDRIYTVGREFQYEETPDDAKEVVRSWLVSEEMQGTNTDELTIDIYHVEKQVRRSSMLLKDYLNLDGDISEEDMEKLRDDVVDTLDPSDSELLYIDACFSTPYRHSRKIPKRVAEALRKVRNDTIATYTSVYQYDIEEEK